MSQQTTETKPSSASRIYEEEEKVFTPSPAPTKAPGKAGRAKETLNILGTALPILGAFGTCFVWTVANFYVGDVEIQTSRPFSTMTVKVFDEKGSEATFHTPKFQLMPGNYHLVIDADKNSTQQADTNVAFHAKTIVQVQLPSDLERPEAEAATAKPKHFWQKLWKKN